MKKKCWKNGIFLDRFFCVTRVYEAGFLPNQNNIAAILDLMQAPIDFVLFFHVRLLCVLYSSTPRVNK